MINRIGDRQGGAAAAVLGAMLAMTVAALPAAAEELTEVSFMEPIHSLFYAPLYVADGKGFFAQEGIKVDFAVSQGSDKATAALLSGSADVVLVGPETAVYIAGGRSPVKTRIFSGLTATDGSFLMGRKGAPGVGADGAFDWSTLKGATIMSWRKGSAPALFMEAALRKAGLDPETDVTLITNTAIPARVGAFMAGTADYGTFFEPDVSRIEAEGKATALANVGGAVGPIDYTVFVATEPFIENHPEVIQGWTDAIARGLAWTASADPAEVAGVLAPYFPGVDQALLADSVVRHRAAGIWKTTPLVEPAAIDGLQTLLTEAGILKPEARVAYDDVVITRFAEAAPKAVAAK
jgi:NitT/TauT family transport system substrate-binding protein